MKRTVVATAAALTLAVVGCASTRPPNQLVDARIAFQQASSSPGAAMATTDIFEAKQALEAAERAFHQGKTREAKNLAYIAHRKALSAQARAETQRAIETKRVALADFQRFREMQAVATREQLEREKGALTIAQREAEAQRQAREAAEAKVADIEGIQARKSEKGLVLTISGSVLFPSGKSELLPSAKERLSEVAKALKDDRRTLLVVGHTDSRGADEANERLSGSRASAVRSYLVSEGIDDDRIRSEGMGESEPVADNATAEGRANNRRVEIVVEASPGSGHTEKPTKEEGEKKAKPKAKEEPAKGHHPSMKEEPKKAAPKKERPKKEAPKEEEPK
jgi:outer membrane protein OmpA-like peptidoglycan-associated protein